MMAWKGILWALVAACANASIDATRKVASNHISSQDLVCVVAIFEAVLSASFVIGLGSLEGFHLRKPAVFATATTASSLLLLGAKFMYQKALQMSALSVTVPYLSFTPAILVVTAFVFVGEKPTLFGLIGVFIVTSGGYLLSLQKVAAAVAPLKQRTAPSSPQTPALEKKGSMKAKHSTQDSIADVDLETAVGEKLHGPSPLKLPAPKQAATISICGYRPELGTVLMFIVAALWSVTAALDKIGVVNSPSVAVFIASERLIIGSCSLVYVLIFSRHSLNFTWNRFWMMLAIASLELTSVTAFLTSLDYILVSYCVAIKRCGVLLSVLMGCILFKEDGWSRMPYILLMLSGMMLIVLDPGQTSVH